MSSPLIPRQRGIAAALFGSMTINVSAYTVTAASSLRDSAGKEKRPCREIDHNLYIRFYNAAYGY